MEAPVTFRSENQEVGTAGGVEEGGNGGTEVRHRPEWDVRCPSVPTCLRTVDDLLSGSLESLESGPARRRRSVGTARQRWRPPTLIGSLLRPTPIAGLARSRTIRRSRSRRVRPVSRAFIGSLRDHHHRAVRVLDALITDRAQEQLPEPTRAAGAHDQEVGRSTRLGEPGPGARCTTSERASTEGFRVATSPKASSTTACPAVTSTVPSPNQGGTCVGGRSSANRILRSEPRRSASSQAQFTAWRECSDPSTPTTMACWAMLSESLGIVSPSLSGSVASGE